MEEVLASKTCCSIRSTDGRGSNSDASAQFERMETAASSLAKVAWSFGDGRDTSTSVAFFPMPRRRFEPECIGSTSALLIVSWDAFGSDEPTVRIVPFVDDVR